MTEQTLQEQLRSADCRGCEHMSDRAADTIDALRAEAARLRVYLDDQADTLITLRAEIERLHQTWVRGDLTQTDFNKAFKETDP